VALVALIEPRRSGELSGVTVRVTVGAELELDFVERVLAFCDMTLGALQARVSALQRIGAGRVLLDAELRGLETVNGVASGALAGVRAFGELSVMRVWFVAINALVECDRLLEVCLRVAFDALHLLVFSEQGVFGFRVIEVLAEAGGHLFPSGGRVTRLASLLEAAVVNVGMAIGALGERKSGISWLAVRASRMAFLALHLGVQTGERIACLGVVELLDGGERFPVGEVVALLAICAEPPLVRILVAGSARLGNAKESLAQVFDLDDPAVGWRHVVGRVAAIAGQAGVFCL
jgi:hypothetical protein